MAILNTTIYGAFGKDKEIRTTQGGTLLGSLLQLPDGSLYRYAKAGEALGAGNLIQTPLKVANHDMDLAVAADVAIGASVITATLGATLATVDQYKDGWAYINDGPGEGHRYRVRDHLAVASAGVITLNLEEGDTVREALTSAASLCGLMANPYNGGLLYNITTADGVPTGFATGEVANGEFCWLQTRGWGAVLIVGTAVIGQKGIPAIATTSGGVAPHVITGDDSPAVCVFQDPIAVTTDYGWAYITIE